MTAIVGILNKRGAVMAADSAVTVTNGGKTKIYNTATKIFRLSLENPVGVMIFSSSEFMGTPWDVIFKLYRDTKGKQSFYKLKEYAQSFMAFLKAENYFSSIKSQRDYFISELSNFYYTIKDEILEQYQARTAGLSDEEAADIDSDAIIHELLEAELKRVSKMYEEQGVNPEFEDYTMDNMRSYGHDLFDDLMDLCKEDQLPTDMRELWESCFHTYICSLHYYKGTGIVLVGYGNQDIYPSLLPIYISGAFDHRMRYYLDEESAEVITNDNSSSICPFAQKDVMMTLMKGCAPDFFDKLDSVYDESVTAIRQKIKEEMKNAGASEEMLSKIDEIDLSDQKDNFGKSLSDYMQEEYVEGIIEAVESFNIEDMANMAESLIAVTNLQRHISSSDESVGGPIDVAVITRSEGFVWVKHKEWFRQDLNPHTKVYE